MNIGMAKKPPKVVIDTNILVSALIYGGKPQQIVDLVFDKRIFAVASPILLAELTETLIKKFKFDSIRIKQLEKITRKNLQVVHPNKTIQILIDEDDNRVLEAADEGNCDYIVTGDNDLLILGKYKNIKIVTADEFLSIVLKG